MTTDEIITELKNLNEMDMQNVMEQTKEYIEDKSHYPSLIRRVFVRDDVDALESKVLDLKSDLGDAKKDYDNLLGAVKAFRISMDILITE